MGIFKKIRSLFEPDRKEQVLGYSVDELKVIFGRPFPEGVISFNGYPKITSLASVEINAFYFSLLIDKSDLRTLLSMIEQSFLLMVRREFNGAPVTQYASQNNNERLVCLIADEFNGKIIRIVTDSVAFVKAVMDCGFFVPPPWVAFGSVAPYWRPGSMQGAEGYYDALFFSPFFEGLSDATKNEYFLTYSTSNEWRRIIELFYSRSE